MKKYQLFVSFFLLLSVFSVSCQKDDDEKRSAINVFSTPDTTLIKKKDSTNTIVTKIDTGKSIKAQVISIDDTIRQKKKEAKPTNPSDNEVNLKENVEKPNNYHNGGKIVVQEYDTEPSNYDRNKFVATQMKSGKWRLIEKRVGQIPDHRITPVDKTIPIVRKK